MEGHIDGFFQYIPSGFDRWIFKKPSIEIEKKKKKKKKKKKI